MDEKAFPSPATTNGNSNALKDQNVEDDLAKVKELSIKLQLSTKRQSVLQWRKIIEEKRRNGLLGKVLSSECSNGVPYAGSQLAHFDQENEELILVVSEENPTPQMMSVDKNSNYFKLNASISNKTEKPEDAIQENLPSAPNCGTQPVTTDANDVRKRRSSNGESESERRRKIDEDLSNIRKDLMLMRLEDRTLARKLLNIRQNMNRTRAALTCEAHAQMLDDFTWEIEEEKELDKKHKSKP